MFKALKVSLIVGIAAIAGSVLIASSGAHIVHAADFRSGDNTVIAKDETIDGSLFVAGDTITVNGNVNGDIFCAGNKITINGSVNGDVLCAGQEVTVAGRVSGDIRAAGNKVTVRSQVGGSVTIAGQTVALEKSSSVKDAQISGGSVLMAGSVLRDASASGQSVDVSGRIGRNLQADTDSLYFSSTAAVTGTTYYNGARDIAQSNGAQIGKVQRAAEQDRDKGNSLESLQATILVLAAIMFLVLGMVVVLLAPRFLYSVSEQGMRHPATAALTGFGATFAPLALIIGAAASVLGLGVAGLAFLVWMIILTLSLPVFAFYLGRLLLARSTDNALLYMFAGLAAVVFIGLLPIIGGIIVSAGGIFGAGMLVSTLVRRWPKPQYKLALNQTVHMHQPTEPTHKPTKKEK